MGAKGRKRREKNYIAAHGGHNRLPPPPDPSSLDDVPSKLRQIMALTNPSLSGSAASSNELRNGRGGSGNHGDKKLHSKVKSDSRPTGEGNDEHSVTAQHKAQDDQNLQNSTQEKRKKTKKRKRVSDLRFETVEKLGIVGLKRRERNKKRLEAKKLKRKKSKSEAIGDFPGPEKIEFGDVVQAPPKLVAFPKAMKGSHDASQERLRLKAVEAYRNRKGWTSRPGINLPPPVMTSPSF
ncbi:hypothetical protein U1Q18_027143 [Sarracenia purpurea var. burkii]